jgi:hypothetical protein
LVLWTEIDINYLGWIMIQFGDGWFGLHSELCKQYRPYIYIYIYIYIFDHQSGS